MITGAFFLVLWWTGYRVFVRATADSKELTDMIKRGDHEAAKKRVGLKPYGTDTSIGN